MWKILVFSWITAVWIHIAMEGNVTITFAIDFPFLNANVSNTHEDTTTLPAFSILASTFLRLLNLPLIHQINVRNYLNYYKENCDEKYNYLGSYQEIH